MLWLTLLFSCVTASWAFLLPTPRMLSPSACQNNGSFLMAKTPRVLPIRWAELRAYTLAEEAKLPAKWAELRVTAAAQQEQQQQRRPTMAATSSPAVVPDVSKSTSLIQSKPRKQQQTMQKRHSRWFRNTRVLPSQSELLPINQGGSISNVVQRKPVWKAASPSSPLRGGQLMDINRGRASVSHVIQSKTSVAQPSMTAAKRVASTAKQTGALMDINQGGDISTVVRHRVAAPLATPMSRTTGRSAELMDINKGSVRVAHVVQQQPLAPQSADASSQQQQRELMDINKGSASVAHVVQQSAPTASHMDGSSQPQSELMDINKGRADVSHVIQRQEPAAQPHSPSREQQGTRNQGRGMLMDINQGGDISSVVGSRVVAPLVVSRVVRGELMDINKGSARVSHVVQQPPPASRCMEASSQPQQSELMDINKGRADVSRVIQRQGSTTQQQQSASVRQLRRNPDRGALMDINQGGDISSVVRHRPAVTPLAVSRVVQGELMDINKGSASVSKVVKQEAPTSASKTDVSLHYSQRGDRGELMDINKGSVAVSHVVTASSSLAAATYGTRMRQQTSPARTVERGAPMDINQGGNIASAGNGKQRETRELQSINQGGDILGVVQSETIG